MINIPGFNYPKLSLLIILTGALFYIQAAKVKKQVIKLRVTQTHAYCGGMEPDKELLEELNTPKALPGKKLVVRKGESNNTALPVVAELTCNGNGVAYCKLAIGKYCIVDERKKDESYIKKIYATYKKESQYNSAANWDCLVDWLKTPDLVFEVLKKDSIFVSVNYHFPCSWYATPCVRYHGPLPP